VCEIVSVGVELWRWVVAQRFVRSSRTEEIVQGLGEHLRSVGTGGAEGLR